MPRDLSKSSAVALGKGDFYAEPVPAVDIHRPSRRWHIGKVLLEQTWLRGWV